MKPLAPHHLPLRKCNGVDADVPAGDLHPDAAKRQLFCDVRAGKVRILFGTTQKVVTRTNVQERLIALHHLDAPGRPTPSARLKAVPAPAS
jgi:hypothetical protein